MSKIMTLVHIHEVTGDEMIPVDATTADRWTARLNRDMGHGEWAAVPPAGSDWERADWESLAQRAGVA